ncbi:MAG: hypothetical protein KC800_31335 [Candidatus Eremiobacteraeota bacterium]|nr:hypothetical protein [Candidatus Eremiobacteraeota bacterium]
MHYRLLSRARGDHRWILDARYRKGLEDYVFRPEHEKGLLQGLQDDDPSVVLLSAKLFAGHCPDKRLLCEALLRVTECETPFIRRTALNYLAANQIPKEQAGSLIALIPLCFAGTPGDAAALLAALSAVEGEHDKTSGSVADAWPTLYFF